MRYRLKPANSPIGLVLCADKSESVVKYTLPEDNKQIFTSKYKLYLPTENELLRELEMEQAVIGRENGVNWEAGQ